MAKTKQEILEEIEKIKKEFNQRIAEIRYERDKKIQDILDSHQIKKIRKSI